MKKSISFTGAASLLLLLAGSAFAGDWTAGLFSGDANSGINSGLTYTAKADFAGGGATINGVSITDTGLSGTGYTLSGAINGHGGNANSLTGSISVPAQNFNFTGDGSGNATLTLSDLTIGQQYIATWNSTNWGGLRNVVITPSDTGTGFRYNQDSNSNGAGGILRYAYTATATTQTFTFDADSNGDSFHHYLFTNAVRNDSVLSYVHFTPIATTGAVYTEANGNAPFTVSNTDLLQTSLSGGVVTSAHSFNLEGTGGASVLNNGNFSITGIGNNNPELATIQNSASAVYNLDTVAAPFGYDITGVTGYGGWNDGGRDQISYSVYLSVVGSNDWTLYGTVNDNPGAPGSPSAVKAELTGLFGNVDAVRFDFLNGVENGHVGLGELDVFGAPSVPEPSSVGLLAAALALTARRRRA